MIRNSGLSETYLRSVIPRLRLMLSRYITSPATVDGHKFDLRFYVAVRCAGAQPEVAVHRQFYCRRANEPWQMPAAGLPSAAGTTTAPGEAHAAEFPTAVHLTVQCYAQDPSLREAQVFYSGAEFQQRWIAEHAGESFDSVVERIHKVLHDLFACAAAEMGDSEKWPSSRGLYGVDILLSTDASPAAAEDTSTSTGGSLDSLRVQPVVLEANYSPDATRMVQYHPQFYDEIFEYLFAPQSEDQCSGDSDHPMLSLLLPGPPESLSARRGSVEWIEAVVARVLKANPTIGMKQVFAAVRDKLGTATACSSSRVPAPPTVTAKQVRRALAAVKAKTNIRPHNAGGGGEVEADSSATTAQGGQHQARGQRRRRPTALPEPGSVEAWDEQRVPLTDCADYSSLRVDAASLTNNGATTAFLRRAADLIATHRSLLEEQAFDVYFLVDCMWERLVPAEWRMPLEGASAATLAQLALGRVPRDWPASLHEYVRAAQAAQLDPTPPPPPPRPSASSPAAWRRHWRGASPKKREEIERMAACIDRACRRACARTVVDVGSGKGYLSSLLALEYQLQVVAVESDHGNSVAAAERVRRIRREAGVGEGMQQHGGAPIFLTAKVLAPRVDMAALAGDGQRGMTNPPAQRLQPTAEGASAAVIAAAAKEERESGVSILEIGPF